MEIKKTVIAGTLESSDIQIILSPATGDNLEIELESDVLNQFGNQIKKVITETLQKFQITKVHVKAIDQGALDCVIRARTITAVQRALGQTEPAWEEL